MEAWFDWPAARREDDGGDVASWAEGEAKRSFCCCTAADMVQGPAPQAVYGGGVSAGYSEA